MTAKNVLDFVRKHAVGISDAWQLPDGSVTFSRLPLYTDDLHLKQLFMMEVTRNTSGVRLEFRTDASQLRLKLIATQLVFPGAPTARIAVDIEIDGGASVTYEVARSEVSTPFSIEAMDGADAPEVEIELAGIGVMKSVKVWLPQNAQTRIYGIELDGAVEALAPSGSKWLHYGSSISQSSEVKSPSHIWPAVAAKSLGLHLRSVGLGGNALLDPFIADVMVEEMPDLISLKLGINIVNAASHNARTFPSAVNGLLDGIRRGLPNTPILLITPIHCPPHEEGVGPTVFNMQTFKATASPRPEEFIPMALNLTMVREQLGAIFANRSATDANLYFMDGLDLFGAADAHLLPDDLHPNHEGYQLMAQRFAAAPVVREWLD